VFVASHAGTVAVSGASFVLPLAVVYGNATTEHSAESTAYWNWSFSGGSMGFADSGVLSPPASFVYNGEALQPFSPVNTPFNVVFATPGDGGYPHANRSGINEGFVPIVEFNSGGHPAAFWVETPSGLVGPEPLTVTTGGYAFFGGVHTLFYMYHDEASNVHLVLYDLRTGQAIDTVNTNTTNDEPAQLTTSGDRFAWGLNNGDGTTTIYSATGIGFVVKTIPSDYTYVPNDQYIND
jgi:hypothetical protein